MLLGKRCKFIVLYVSGQKEFELLKSCMAHFKLKLGCTFVVSKNKKLFFSSTDRSE